MNQRAEEPKPKRQSREVLLAMARKGGAATAAIPGHLQRIGVLGGKARQKQRRALAGKRVKRNKPVQEQGPPEDNLVVASIDKMLAEIERR